MLTANISACVLLLPPEQSFQDGGFPDMYALVDKIVNVFDVAGTMKRDPDAGKTRARLLRQFAMFVPRR